VALRQAGLIGLRVEQRLVDVLRSGSNLTGTVFRELDPEDAEFSGAQLCRTQWLRCSQADVGLPDMAPSTTRPAFSSTLRTPAHPG
jgi:hypothetical protein